MENMMTYALEDEKSAWCHSCSTTRGPGETIVLTCLYFWVCCIRMKRTLTLDRYNGTLDGRNIGAVEKVNFWWLAHNIGGPPGGRRWTRKNPHITLTEIAFLTIFSCAFSRKRKCSFFFTKPDSSFVIWRATMCGAAIAPESLLCEQQGIVNTIAYGKINIVLSPRDELSSGPPQRNGFEKDNDNAWIILDIFL